MPIEYFIPVVESDEQPKLTHNQKQALVEESCCLVKDWETMTRAYRENGQEAIQLYQDNRPIKQSYDTEDAAHESSSKVRRPILAQAVDSVLAQQHMASYPSDERFFKGRGKTKMTNKIMPAYEKHLERRLAIINYMMSSYVDRKTLSLIGTSVVWHPFIRKTERKTIYDHTKILGIPIPGTLKKKTKDVVSLEMTGHIPVNFNDCFFDPLASTLEEAGFIWRRWVSPQAISQVDVFENTDDIEAYAYVEISDQSQIRKEQAYRYMGIDPTFADKEYKTAATHALLYERWDDFYIDGEFYENHVLIFSNDKLFHYFGPNPYDHQRKPFTVKPYNPSAGTLLGKSLATDIIPLCHAQDTFLNQQIDLISRFLNPWFTYLANDEILREHFKDGMRSIIPGEGIPVQGHQSIELRTWDVSSIDFLSRAMMMLKEETRESTGGVPYATGGTSNAQGDRTLGEVEILANGTNTRNQFFIEAYEEGGSKPFIEMVFSNDKQFMSEAVYVDDEETLLTPDTIKLMDADFDITGSKTIASRSQDQQNIDMLLTTYLPLMFQNGLATTNGDKPEFNLPELLKRWFASRNFRNIDQFMEVQTQEEVQQQQEQIAQENPGAQLGGMTPDGLQALSGAAGPSQVRNLGGPTQPPGL